MITLDTRVLDLTANNSNRPAGHYICPVDFEGQVMGMTLNDDAKITDIMGAGSYAADPGRELIEILPDGRNGITATCDYQTEIAVLCGDNTLQWIPACSLNPRHHSIIVPDVDNGFWCLVPSAFNMRRYRHNPERYATGVQPTLARLVLRDRARHFTTLACVISSRLAGEE